MRKRSLFERKIKLHSKLIIGLNSGTSADGIDTAIIRIKGSGLNSKVEFLCGATYKYRMDLRAEILKCAEPEFRDGVKWLGLNARLIDQFSLTCKKIVKKAGISLEDIDLIGSHGQTIRHLPNTKYGALTYQLADPSGIAVKTGLLTIGDFRVADTVAGGQGAPLTPIVNNILFNDKRKNIAVLNIGGIANITVISNKSSRLFGCDTGPGNMVIDRLMMRLYNQSYDKSGLIASKGQPDYRLIEKILTEKYYAVKGPKSAGRENYGNTYIESFLRRCRQAKLSKADIISTASFFTAAAVAKCIKINKLAFDSLILTGGGAKNKFIVNGLKSLLTTVEIKSASDYNYPADYLEAISFAVLANEALYSNSYDLSEVTGSGKRCVLGKICQP